MFKRTILPAIALLLLISARPLAQHVPSPMTPTEIKANFLKMLDRPRVPLNIKSLEIKAEQRGLISERLRFDVEERPRRRNRACPGPGRQAGRGPRADAGGDRSSRDRGEEGSRMALAGATRPQGDRRPSPSTAATTVSEPAARRGPRLTPRPSPEPGDPSPASPRLTRSFMTPAGTSGGRSTISRVGPMSIPTGSA